MRSPARGATIVLTLALALLAAPAAGAAAPDEGGAALAAPEAPAANPPGALPADVQLESREGYNSDYLFGMTRGVAYSTLTPALKPLAFVFTIPLDVALLPFAFVGGFFG